MSTLHVPIGPLNPSQEELLRWQPPAGVEQVTCGLLSAGYGSGKSWGCALRFARDVLAIPRWRPEMPHRPQPKAIVISPSFSNLASNIMPMLERILAPVIVTRRVTPTPWWTLHNGVRVEFYSLGSLVDGMSALVMWIDEVTHHQLVEGPAVWRRLLGRLRGFRGERKTLIVSGIAAMHPVIRERFHRPHDPSMRIIMPGIRENRGLDEDTIRAMLEAAPAEARDAIEHGGWIPLRENVYSLDPHLHRYDGPIDRSAPCSVGYDPGKQACAVVGQWCGDRYVIVDEVIGSELDSEALMARVVARGWSQVQTVVIDSQASADTPLAIQRVLPQAYIVQQPKRSAAWRVQHGIERVQWALRDATGQVRLQFAGALWDHGHPERGVVRSLAGYRYKESGVPVRDNTLDHQCDAVRMLVTSVVDAPERDASRDYSTAYTETW